MTTLMIDARGVSKTFVLHQQGGLRLPVLTDAGLQVRAGECVALTGPSGAGKSTLLKVLYANYLADSGRIAIRHHDDWIDMRTAAPHDIVAVRRDTLGYVSQFLRVIPRVGALDVVAEPLVRAGTTPAAARDAAAALLARLNIPERLWNLPPGTFSGGEQQRVNIARGLIAPRPVLLLDEPTASLDAANRAVVIGLMREARARGAALVGIFHDAETRDAIADRLHPVLPAGKEADAA